MSLHEVMIEGTLQPDGTLQLDSKPSLPPGRITVVLRQESEPVLPKDDPFWQRMQAMWDVQKAQGYVPRSSAEIEAEQRQMRDEWEEHQLAIERLQEECHLVRQAQEGPQP